MSGQSYPYDCIICHDTGTVRQEISCVRPGSTCWCRSGARLYHQALIRTAASLSSGTLATLTGYRDYATLDRIQADFVAWVSQPENGAWASWQDGWEHFWPAHPLANEEV